MKEHPILFSTPMVQAILAGRKSQTRRIIKPQPHSSAREIVSSNQWKGKDFVARFKYDDQDIYEVTNLYRCPYGQPGDHLWVRETFSIIGTEVSRDPGSYAIIDEAPQYVYKGQKQPHIEKLLKWKPSIFMPRTASRITLLITDIRVERLQDISNEDAIAEGINMGETPCIEPMNAYAILWESINGKGSWDANPFVWVIKFERIEKQENETK